MNLAARRGRQGRGRASMRVTGSRASGARAAAQRFRQQADGFEEPSTMLHRQRARSAPTA
jgi:hypothetical protein